MKKNFTAHAIFAATALATQQAWALSFGRPVSDAVIGQVFTFTVPVNVDAGEHFGPECLATQVFFGDSPVPANAVRADVERGAADGAWVVRVTTSLPVQEPIVEIALGAGCERRFTRRFSVFADPPSLGPTAAQVAPPVAALAVAMPASAAASSALGRAFAAQRGSSAPAGRARVVRKGPTMALAHEIAAAPPARRPVDGGSAHKAGTQASTPAPVDTSRLVLDAGVAHLKLDMEEPVIPPSAGASGVVPGLDDSDDLALRQLKALQQSLDAVRRDTDAQRVQAAKLQAELEQARSHGDWTPWLLALLALAAAAIAALAWKLRQQNRIAHSDWFNQSRLGPATVLPPAEALAADAPASELPDIPATAVATEEPLPELPVLDDDGDARGAPILVDPSATRPLDRHALAGVLQADATPRELSVEELLDLEQQADFFIALGQEDAAVDLLMSHLRSAGGQSPLPYTKLLEIYRRQGDRSAYERTRARFNRRFNAYAPDWDTGPSAGRTLEDYPGTVALLERAWRSPIDAMALLESLLFKRDDTSELFDLPAYRDILVLYSLARDLWQHGGDGGSPIDVLLPLDETGRTVPSYASAREINERGLPARDAGLDLDLESVDAEGDTRNGMLTSFEMTGYDASASGGGHLDLELPPGDVHATLDELSLSPVAPTRPKPAPEWRDPDGAGPDQPPKR